MRRDKRALSQQLRNNENTPEEQRTADQTNQDTPAATDYDQGMTDNNANTLTEPAVEEPAENTIEDEDQQQVDGRRTSNRDRLPRKISVYTVQYQSGVTESKDCPK